MSGPDPRPQRRVRDLELLKRLHVELRGECVLVELGGCVEHRYSLHHIHKHPRDDLAENLAMTCGDGTTGHHAAIEAHEFEICRAFARYLLTERLDTIEYLGRKLRSPEAVRTWLNEQLYAGL